MFYIYVWHKLSSEMHRAFLHSQNIYFFFLCQAVKKQVSVKYKCAERNFKWSINSLMSYYKRCYVTVKWSHGVVSRLWFGMLLWIAPSMFFKKKHSFNCYVKCLHMWLLSVNSLYMYPNMFSIVLDFAGHSWMTWQFKKQMFCVVVCNAYSLWCVLS